MCIGVALVLQCPKYSSLNFANKWKDSTPYIMAEEAVMKLATDPDLKHYFQAKVIVTGAIKIEENFISEEENGQVVMVPGPSARSNYKPYYLQLATDPDLK